jgi:hypothetical protein
MHLSSTSCATLAATVGTSLFCFYNTLLSKSKRTLIRKIEARVNFLNLSIWDFTVHGQPVVQITRTGTYVLLTEQNIELLDPELARNLDYASGQERTARITPFEGYR